MHIHRKGIALMMLVLILVVGCAKADPTATLAPPTNTQPPPTETTVPPMTPTDTQPPPTNTPVPTAPPTPLLTDTPLPPTAKIQSDAGSTWIRTYGGDQDDVSGDLLLADDGGYFIVGTTNLQFEPQQQGDIYLIRTDAAGEVLWEKTYGGEGYQAGGTIFPTDDGGLMLAGWTSSMGAGGIDTYLIKLDQDGDEIWSKTFGGPLDEMATAWPLPDGGYMVGGNIVDPDDVVADPGAAGYGGFAGRSNIYLAKIDEEGNEVWSRAYGGEKNVIATSGLQTPDGGFLVLATIMYYPVNDDDIYLLKLDENGDGVWSRTWDEGTTNSYDLIQTSDGDYLISGSYSPPGDADESSTDDSLLDFLFIKVDPEGNELWTSVFGDPDMIDYGTVLAETEDGGYVASGERVVDYYSWDADITLVKTDENGQPLWGRVFETSAHSMFSALLQHPDGGYVIAGSSFNGRTFDIFMIKTDSEGNVDDLTTSAATIATVEEPVLVSASRAGDDGGGKIVFYSARDGYAEIYIINADGSDLRRLTNNRVEDLSPAISPDGSQIAFVSQRDGNSEIYLMNVDGSQVVRLTHNPAYDSHPAWSPDDAKIAFVSERDGNQEIYVMNVDGTGLERLTEDPADDMRPSWSPDGARIAFNRMQDGNWEIYVMEADGGNPQRLTESERWEIFPAWSPDGSRIAYMSTMGRGSKLEIHVMKADGSDDVPLPGVGRVNEDPAWSPDGTQLVFQSNRDGNWEVYIMDADGGNQRRLTTDPAGDYWPSWGP